MFKRKPLTKLLIKSPQQYIAAWQNLRWRQKILHLAAYYGCLSFPAGALFVYLVGPYSGLAVNFRTAFPILIITLGIINLGATFYAQIFPCPRCGNRFLGEVARAEIVELKDPDYRCPYCDLQIWSTDDPDAHHSDDAKV